MTKAEERSLLYAFKESFKDFPIGEITHPDSPDFIIKDSEYRIGIEVTEIFQDSYLKASKLKQIQSYHKKTALLLLTKIQKSVHFPFSLHMNYNDQYIHESSSDLIVEECLEVCLPFIRQLENGELFHMDNPLLLPKQVRRISISRFDQLSKSYYGENEGGAVADLEEKHIVRLLLDKENKLEKYEPCNEHWLLIREGNYYAGSFSEILIKCPIQSKFDKVFLFRSRRRQVIQLK